MCVGGLYQFNSCQKKISQGTSKYRLLTEAHGISPDTLRCALFEHFVSLPCQYGSSALCFPASASSCEEESRCDAEVAAWGVCPARSPLASWKGFFRRASREFRKQDIMLFLDIFRHLVSFSLLRISDLRNTSTERSSFFLVSYISNFFSFFSSISSPLVPHHLSCLFSLSPISKSLNIIPFSLLP